MTDYLTLDDVRGLHADVMRRTSFLPAPVRDLGALESAIMRPQTVAHCEGADLLIQAVTLMLAISQAQAFVDGSKRTAMFAALVFLALNGCTFDEVKGPPLSWRRLGRWVTPRGPSDGPTLTRLSDGGPGQAEEVATLTGGFKTDG